MPNLPSVASYIQVAESEFRAPVSESTMQKYGSTNNFLLDHFPVQPGTVHAFAGLEVNIPGGYICCDGRTFSRTGATANLFAAIGTLYGSGDGLTTANVPDLRGLFIRMVDLTTRGQAGNDPGHASRTPIGSGTSEQPGSYESDQLGSHQHTLPINGGGSGASVQSSSDSANFGTGQVTGLTGGAETRPKNLYFIYMIKT